MRARVAELVDASGLKPAAERRTGSIPVPRTKELIAFFRFAIVAAAAVGQRRVRDTKLRFYTMASARAATFALRMSSSAEGDMR